MALIDPSSASAALLGNKWGIDEGGHLLRPSASVALCVVVLKYPTTPQRETERDGAGVVVL
jgi:hypothetical protein